MFKRDVLINGIVYNAHRVGGIWSMVGDASTVFVQHVEGEIFDANWIETQHRHELDWSLTPEQAEEWVKELPEFEEYVDPEASLIEQMADMLDDEEAASVPQAFKEWQPDTAYQVGDRRRFEDVLYKCLQAHTSQEGWEPNQAPSLWARILNPDPEVIPVWEQPDSTNPYMTGDKVHYPDAEGPVYESTIDNNVWSPEAYPAGWQLVEEEA